MKNLNIGEAVTQVVDRLNHLYEHEMFLRDKFNHYHRMMVDLQHEIEMSGGSYSDEMKVSVFNHMRGVSLKRREYKDQLITIGILKDLFKAGIQLSDLKGKFESDVSSWERNYSPRVLKDLDFSDEVSLGMSRLEINSKNIVDSI